jgi:hypothetical protein
MMQEPPGCARSQVRFPPLGSQSALLLHESPILCPHPMDPRPSRVPTTIAASAPVWRRRGADPRGAGQETGEDDDVGTVRWPFTATNRAARVKELAEDSLAGEGGWEAASGEGPG